MLQEIYKKEVIAKMQKEYGFKNSMAIPKITKVVINTGFGRQATSLTKDQLKRFIETVENDVSAITGQKAVLTRAHKSISSFKLRQGLVIGAKVTLRGKRMYDFLERLVYIAMPRTRDFRGIDTNNVDKNGNLSIGIKEHTVFPEIIQDKEKQILGMEITVVTTAKNHDDALTLFKLMGFPFKK